MYPSSLFCPTPHCTYAMSLWFMQTVRWTNYWRLLNYSQETSTRSNFIRYQGVKKYFSSLKRNWPLNCLWCREMEISKSGHISVGRFKECELIDVQLDIVDNGFILSYVAICNSEILPAKYPWTSPFSIRLKSLIVENYFENLIDF